jgi:hypothetical protein
MRVALLAIALAAIACATLFMRPHPTPGPPMRDFEAYYAAGTVWNAGEDPYSQAIWRAEKRLPGVDASRYEALPFVAPPVILPPLGAIAKLPFAVANALWRVLLAAAIPGLAFIVLRFAQVRPSRIAFVAVAAAAVGFGPLTSALALGQLALPAMFFASLSLLWPPAALGAWIQPNVGIALFSQARAWIAAVIFGALCVVLEGANGIWHYADVLHRHSMAERFSAIQLTPAAIAYGFGAAAPVANALAWLVALGAIGFWFAVVRRTGDATARFCITCALLPLVMPFFHEHDLVVLFVPVVVYAICCERRVWPLATFGALLAGTDWLGLAQRPDGAVQTLLLAGALGLALAALRDRIDPRMLLVPAGAIALIAIAAAVVHQYPLGVWPDAMGALPKDAASLDIASAWNAQQRATGLFARQPVWALLRLFSLGGCALTAYAIALSSKSPADSKNPSPALAASS